jgi:hypothetical protein
MAHEGREDGESKAPATTSMRGWLSRNARYAIAGVVAITIAVGVFAITRGGDEQETEASLADAGQGSEDSRDEDSDDPAITPGPVVGGVSTAPAFPTPQATGTEISEPGVTPVAISTSAPPDPTAAVATPTSTPVIGNPSSATPSVATPGPTLELTQAAADLADQIESRHGIRIARSEQNWGSNGSDQMRNLTSLGGALQSLPAAVVNEVAEADGGTLVFLSNNTGSTEAGWQPYGNRPANYYTNEDLGPNGRVPANQVVVQTGSTSQTIAHEVIHAYQLRNVGPGQYVLGLLTDEVKSFMQATGWRQLVSDDEIRANSSGSWADINKFFVYEGRPLNYINEHGTLLTLYAPNPMEAFAESAGLYYAGSFAAPLPDWPEYWEWFDGNLN